MVIRSLAASLLFLVFTAFTNHLPAESATLTGTTVNDKTSVEAGLERMDAFFQTNYNLLTGSAAKPSFAVYKKALTGYYNLKKEGKLKKEIISIVDFTLPSNKKRLWVIDLAKNLVLVNDLVAHGRNTGNIVAENFSNLPDSHMSSLGFYVTGNTYFGKHGLSLRLKGMEANFNGNAMKRAIVLHGADYVSEDFIKNYGRLGRSFGCPAVSSEISAKVIDSIKESSCFFIYSSASQYDTLSSLLNRKNALTFLTAQNILL